MTRRYEFKTKRGLLKEIKIISTETVKKDKLTDEWLDANYIELLLNIDDNWRTPRQLMKDSQTLRDIGSSSVVNGLKMLKDRGLIEHRRVSNKHAEYRRAYSFATHGVER